VPERQGTCLSCTREHVCVRVRVCACMRACVCLIPGPGQLEAPGRAPLRVKRRVRACLRAAVQLLSNKMHARACMAQDPPLRRGSRVRWWLRSGLAGRASRDPGPRRAACGAQRSPSPAQGRAAAAGMLLALLLGRGASRFRLAADKLNLPGKPPHCG